MKPTPDQRLKTVQEIIQASNRRDDDTERKNGEKVDYALDLCLIAEAVFEDEPDLENLIERAAGNPSVLRGA